MMVATRTPGSIFPFITFSFVRLQSIRHNAGFPIFIRHEIFFANFIYITEQFNKKLYSDRK